MTASQCKRCLYTTEHPLGLILDDEGVCSGCRVHEEKDTLDWQAREDELRKLIAPYRITDKRQYDCIVPVTGGGDSYYILHLVKNVLGLNPLLVSYNNYWNTPLGIRNLANLRIKFNCDILLQNVNPLSVKKIVKTTLRQLGSIYWQSIAGQTVFPVQVAVRKKIPLIFWGAHQGVEQVGMFSHLNNVEMSRRYRKDHDLMGFEADDLISNFDILNERDIWQYRYPDDLDIYSVGVRGIYLGNYFRWDPKSQHEQMIKLYDYQTSKFNRTFDCYDHVNCYNYMGVHDLLKKFKKGYSKYTDHAVREIRHGRLEKCIAVEQEDSYQLSAVPYFDLFCEWLNVDKKAMWLILKDYDSLGVNLHNDTGNIKLGFWGNSSMDYGEQQSYVVIGKGWPNQ